MIAPVTSWRDALLFWSFLLFFAGIIILMAIMSTGRKREMQGFVRTLPAVAIVAELGRRYFRQRKLERATLRVSRWPLRLGDRAKVRFENHLKKGATVDAVSARLICFEEAVSASGRYSQTRRNTRHEVLLDTSRARIEGPSVRDEWEIEIPATALPSFCARRNSIHWRVEALANTGGVDVSADFELLVIPEVTT